MDHMSVLISLMLLEAPKKGTELESYADSNITEHVLELSSEQKEEIVNIFEKYLLDIMKMKKSKLSTEEINLKFDKIVVQSKKKIKKVLTLKQLERITRNDEYNVRSS